MSYDPVRGARGQVSSPALTSGCSTAPCRQDFFLSCSAFNKFAHGSPKLPCSTLSGVECLPYTPCAARLKTSTPQPPSGSSKPHAHRAGIATLPGQQSAAESAPGSTANPNSITARIGGSSPPDSATDRHPQTARPRPQSGAARKPTAKEKLFRTARNPSTYPETPHSLPDRTR